mmetsp:Transcript_21879/g.33930  ORF Transcript_21879/g.33930 Transcript_21879/m.33930 type:complete len:198 (+) Transcript_21879:2683-3276(+)
MPADPNNATYPLGGATQVQNSSIGEPKPKSSKKKKNENDGAAVFVYSDSETGLSQKFAFNLRYYIGAYWDSKNGKSNPDKRQDGAYELAVNGTANQQKSLRYGQVNLKKSRMRQNNDSAEFLLIFEQKYSSQKNATDKIRAYARVQINKHTDFVKFEVGLNEIPIAADKTGKDVLVDWYLMDNFDTQGKLWVDANGL